MILVLIGALALIVGPRLMNRGPRAGGGGRAGGGRPGQPLAEGTLLVTGVSPRPEGVDGQQFVTISGVINGPTVNEHVVYQRMAVDVNQWPNMGQLFPVIYSPKNPDKWNFAPPDGPPPPPPEAPQPPPYAPPGSGN
jgi:hypothetical protein